MERARGRGWFVVTGMSASVFACAGEAPARLDEAGRVSVEAVRVNDERRLAAAGDIGRAAIDYARQLGHGLGLPRDDFHLQAIHTSRGGFKHVRLKQVHGGLPVWGSGVVVHVDDTHILGMNGTLSKHLPLLDDTPSVDAGEALAIARAAHASRSEASAELVTTREAAELVVFPAGREPRVAWRVEFAAELAGPPGLWNYLVDARTGEVLFQLDMMRDWYGQDSIDDQGAPIRGTSGAMDVVAHAIGHSFTQLHAGLIAWSQSGAIDESFADIAGTLAELSLAADADLGRDAVHAEPRAVRLLCNPAADRGAIDHTDDYDESTPLHQASGIMNKAFCLSARRLASGRPDGPVTQASARRAGEAWFEGNASFWTESTTFAQACEGILAAATSLGFTGAECGAIHQSWRDVGVHCDDSDHRPAPLGS